MSPAHINDSIPILVEHIPLGTKESDLMHLFSQYGTTTKVEIVYEG